MLESISQSLFANRSEGISVLMKESALFPLICMYNPDLFAYIFMICKHQKRDFYRNANGKKWGQVFVLVNLHRVIEIGSAQFEDKIRKRSNLFPLFP